MGFHSLVGKTVEQKSLPFPNKTYFGLIVGGRNDYIHKNTGETMFLAKYIFVDLNKEFIEYDFDELDLDPNSPHKLEEARFVNLEEAIFAANNSGWLHHAVSRPSPAITQWCDYRNVPEGHDKITGYELGYHGPKPYTTDLPDLSNKKKKAVSYSMVNRSKRKISKSASRKKSPKQRKFHVI